MTSRFERLRFDLDAASRRSLAAVAITVAALVALAGGLSLLAMTAGERAEAVASEQATLEALTARVRDRSPAAVRAERLLGGDPFLGETSATLAVNAMQRRLASLAGECGVALQTIGRDETREAGFPGLTAVALRIEAQASVAATQKLLYRLETESPFVLVDEIHLRPVERTDAGAEVGRRLSIELVAVGFRRHGEGGA